MKTTVFYPFGSLQREVDQFLSSVFGQSSERGVYASNLNLGEDENAYYVEAVVPGVDPASLEVNVEDQVLRFGGTRVGRPEVEGQRWHLKERSVGQFKQQLRLPSNVAPDKITADYRHGILTLTIPKAEAAKPRQITVQVS